MTYSPGHEKWPEHKVEEKLVRVKDLQDAAWTYEDPYVKRV